ncbi:MAG: hypothetical protein QOI63_796 [Thermoplasmata archaeon]|jgi:uncharacterized membrane protein|nr:hypothetical protein [Thermoplasmata archaeon]
MRIPAADRVMALVGYVPFLFFIPVRFKRDSLFAQFHGRQSGVLWGLWLIAILILLLVQFFLPDKVAPAASVYIFGIAYVLTGVYLLMAAIGMVKVLLGERYRMPLVADVALRLRL